MFADHSAVDTGLAASAFKIGPGGRKPGRKPTENDQKPRSPQKLSDLGPAEGVSVSTPLPSCLHDASQIYQFGTIILWPARRILAKSRVSFLSLHYCTTARSILENARLGHDKQRRAPFSSAPDPDTRSKSALHFRVRTARTREAKSRSILERARPGHEKQKRAPFWGATPRVKNQSVGPFRQPSFERV